MEPTEVIAALEAPTDDRRRVMWSLREDAPAEALAAALAAAEEPNTRRLLADLLGFQAAPEGIPALPVLREAAEDEDAGLRDSARWALDRF